MSNDIRQSLYLATIAADAPETTKACGLGLELDEFCTAMNMDTDFDHWDAVVRGHLACADRLIFHGPFSELSPCAIDPLVRAVALRRFGQAANLCRRYGVRRMVVHSGFIPNVYFPEWFVEQGSRFFQEFLQSQPSDFQIMIENVLDPDPSPLLELVERIDDPRAGVCLDVGHAHVVSKIPVKRWLTTLAPRLVHLHVHDNDGRFDLHQLPGDGAIGFPALWEDILTTASNATITLECRDAAGCVRRLSEHQILS